MVRRILDGSKTQTRRIAKVVPGAHGGELLCLRSPYAVRLTANGPEWSPHAGAAPIPWDPNHPETVGPPHGKVGDRLWVRETWRAPSNLDDLSPAGIAEKAREAGFEPWSPIRYEADGAVANWDRSVWPVEPGKTRVSIHMPRWASRIDLEITSVRVERLQDISEEDARAEGIDGATLDAAGVRPIDAAYLGGYHRAAFVKLWDSINGNRAAWKANPWVWVIEFRRVRT